MLLYWGCRLGLMHKNCKKTGESEENCFFCVFAVKQKNILFLGVLVERGGLMFVGLSFAHSSLIVRSSFAQGLNRKIFCFEYAGF